MLALLFSLLIYSPAFFSATHDPAKDNLLTALTGWTPAQAEPGFFTAWEEAGQQLKTLRIPLWQAETNQPLLEATNVPALYPGAVFFYLAGKEWGGLVFALAHLWWFIATGGWLVTSSRGLTALLPRSKGFKVALAGLGLVLVVLAGSLRPDWLAALSWLPSALLLAHWKRRGIAFVVLPLPLGLIALTAPIVLTLILYLLVLAYWLLNLHNSALSTQHSALLLSLCVLAGLALAGPQLFPHLNYNGPAFDTAAPAAPPPEIVSASGAQVTQLQRQSDGQILINLTVPAGTKQAEVVLKGRNGPASGEEKTTGWSGQLTAGKGPEIKVTGPAGSTGNQRLSLKFDQTNLPTADTAYSLRLRYLPLSFQLGVYAALLTLVSQGLLLLTLGWLRFYREDETDHPLRRVVKNSATPLFAQLTGKVLDFGFAIFVLRLLGPEGNGEYTFAVLTWVFFAAFCDFGLEGIVTREIARVRQLPNAQEQVNRLFYTKLFLRLFFSVVALPLSLLWIGGFGLTGNLTAASAWAIILLMIGFWPSVVAGSITVVFRGYEKFEFLAAVQLLASIIKVPLGLGALLAGWGPVGLAASSVVVNFIQVAVLQALMRKQVFVPRFTRHVFDRKLAGTLLHESLPLLLNGLIISVLFKSDGLILQAVKGNFELGVYNSAYKFIDALLIIPSTLTMALFPLFSSYGTEAKDSLLRAYKEGLRLLMVIAWPVSAGTVFVAYDLIGALGGTEFLPGGAIALQILIWFLPFSYINGLTQYVLIAINRQRSITWAVVIGAVANVGLNLVLIPLFGYSGAAALTILTEIILLVPFCIVMHRALGPGSVPLFSTNWRPMLASGVMILALLGLVNIGLNNFAIIVVVGGLVYIGGLALTCAVTKEDLALLKKALRR
jgi:O-antigen/teichoic acid export membrane protein